MYFKINPNSEKWHRLQCVKQLSAALNILIKLEPHITMLKFEVLLVVKNKYGKEST